LIVITRPNQVVKMIGAARRPISMYLDDDIALACFQPDLELILSAKVYFNCVRVKEGRLHLLKNQKSQNENPGHGQKLATKGTKSNSRKQFAARKAQPLQSLTVTSL
jgi:hypothetical protein